MVLVEGQSPGLGRSMVAPQQRQPGGRGRGSGGVGPARPGCLTSHGGWFALAASLRSAAMTSGARKVLDRGEGGLARKKQH